jgi:Fe2+ transport system protein B
MSIELISILTAIVAVGVALAGVILAGSRGLRQDMARLESRLDVRITALESRQEARLNELRGEIGELRERMAHDIGELRERMAHEVSELRERMAKLEGLLEGLREAVTGRVAAG